jgi:hypothetical protein
MKKQFKIGEYAIGGIIAINKTKTAVKIDALDYLTKRVILSGNYDLNDKNNIDNFLHELTTSYYSNKIMQYIYKN